MSNLSKRLREALKELFMASSAVQGKVRFSIEHSVRAGAHQEFLADDQHDHARYLAALDTAKAILAEPADDGNPGEWVSVERSMLERIPRESIAMFQEYRDQYGRDEDDALVAACNEILEGINAYLQGTPLTESA